MSIAINKEKAFLDAYDSFSDAIYRHCFFRVHQKEKAEDLVQETFTKTWKYIQTNELPSNLRAFLYKVANNLIIDDSRKKKEALTLEALREIGMEPSADNSDRLIEFLDGKALANKIKNLEEHYAQVLVLRYIDGFKPKEIAQIINESQNVVSVRINRAKKQLAAIA